MAGHDQATGDAGAGGRVLLAACDGACSGNPGPGGWGALLRFEDGSLREMGGHDPATTNNRMELTAALEVLRALRTLPRHPRLVILTDSRYLIDGLQKWLPGWKRKGWRTASGGPVLNRDLWEQLDGARLEGVELRHVRGHSGHPENDRCDAIAVAFSRGMVPRLAGPPAGRAGRAGEPRTPDPRAGEPEARDPQSRETKTAAMVEGRSVTKAVKDTAVEETTVEEATAMKSTVNNSTVKKATVIETPAKEAPAKEATVEGTAVKQRAVVARAAGKTTVEQTTSQGLEGPADPAPPALRRLLSRLELADRLAAGGHGLTLVELAQLVEQPLAQLERRQGAWRWRDWSVEPIAPGQWRLRRADGGWSDAV